jgi:hypothetical protein
MHNCFGKDQFEKDVEKFIHRWNLHPEYAEALNSWYQNVLRQFEDFSEKQAAKMDEKDSFGRSRQESAAILTGLMTNLKRYAREWMNEHAK